MGAFFFCFLAFFLLQLKRILIHDKDEILLNLIMAYFRLVKIARIAKLYLIIKCDAFEHIPFSVNIL